MLPIFKQAFRDTRAFFSFSPKSFARNGMVFIVAMLLLWFFQGRQLMLDELKDVSLYLSAIGVAALGIFVWNLWLAPYRIMHERLDDALAGLPASHDQNRPTPPEPADASAFANHENYSLIGAACLWAGIEPHTPIQDASARAKLNLLKAAVISGDLECVWGNELANRVKALEGTTEPPESIRIHRSDLCKYAESIDNVPEFLKDGV